VQVKNGQFPVVLINGEVKIFAPSQGQEETAQSEKSWKDIKAAFGNKVAFETKAGDSLWRISS